MTAVYYVGDAVATMNRLPESSVDLLLTSPPFFAVRDYLPAGHTEKGAELGQESTPGEFVDNLLDLADAARRVLASHGSLVMELGDTYAGSGGAGGDYSEGGRREGQPILSDATAKRAARKPKSIGSRDERRRATPTKLHTRRQIPGFPLDKSLCLIPETFRWALAWGFNPLTGRMVEPWRIRNVIDWVRTNPTAGDDGDKFRSATSDIVVASMSRHRYWDVDSVRRPVQVIDNQRAVPNRSTPPGQPARLTNPVTAGGKRINANPLGAPPLDWWNVPNRPYKGAHFATWSEELCILPILAMSPERVCLECGRPSERISVRISTNQNNRRSKAWEGDARALTFVSSTEVPDEVTAEQLGWSCCGHGAGCTKTSIDRHQPLEGLRFRIGYRHVRYQVDVGRCAGDHWRPGLVLDPFAGTGTTLAVATGHARDAIGIDLDERNYELALERVGPLVLSRGEVAA